MARIYPVTFVWKELDVADPATGELVHMRAMVPLPRFGNVCGRQYHDGEEYSLTPLEARSRSSHNHYFAAVHDGYQNLPEKIAARWPTEEHLRKWLLIETGWFDEKEFTCPDEDFAKKLGAFVRTENEYARISIHRPTGNHDHWKVIIRVAKSQSAQAMSKEPFEKSKRDVLDLLEALTAVPRGTLMREAGRSA